MNHPHLHRAARHAHAAGLCVIPAATNGTKQPWPGGGTWTRYQHHRPTTAQLDAWFTGRRYDGLGIVCGRVSGNLEMLEFEGRAIAEGLVRELGDIADASGLGDLWARVAAGYRETTPSGGAHLLYRVAGPVAGNTKLARRPATTAELAAWIARQQATIDTTRDARQKARRQHVLDQITSGDQLPQVLIETRGEGGFVVIAPSAGRTHPTGGAWTLDSGGVDSIPTITPAERDALHHLAGALDQMPAPPPVAPPPRSPVASVGLRPGDDYNQRATWDDILIPYGWTKLATRGGTTYWRRPGKDGPGISATTGRNAADRLYVFSTSTVFDAERPYNKFAAYTALTEGQVTPAALSAAGRRLRAQGYGGDHPGRYGTQRREGAA
ncbi:bifunctional DNA primase/polymerase [Spongiactinospora sp. TRM90649]|uniref:bifunctional DNA primase/polymerase n=1 Tax=Spongiactinospora sp. TRM90649 TaxID=3031114 RepID=UPI0023F65580|nr:bifunctional DNA primase/polymerase [Spongiactinospora sp. TRM90649]MDF5755804.1 bifunctional DNA primase/polymerase [Spongiactinospora sp. TRM90649]